MIDAKHFVKEHAARNIPLCFDEAYSLGLYLMEACQGDSLAQIQSIALLTALHNRATYAWQKNGREVGHELPNNAAEQIAGICAAVFEHDIAKSEFGFLTPNVPYAMDNCGMGGDFVVTANVSSVAAFIAAAAGIPMCKHGSPANADKGRHGSSDFIDLCGINRFADKKAVERCVEDLSFGYTEALDVRYKHIHLQTHNIAFLPHMNDIIGPITNPLSPRLMSRRVLGVNHLIPVSIVAEAYQILNGRGITHLQQGFFVRGFGDKKGHESGMDELSICQGGTELSVIKNGYMLGWGDAYLSAKDFGLEPIPAEFASPTSGMSKGEFSLAILKGEGPEPSIQMVLANAALLFRLAERSTSLKECYLMAREVLMSGKAFARMVEIREMLPAK